MGSGMTAGGIPANRNLGRGDQVDFVRAADNAPGTMVQVGVLNGLDGQGGANGSVGALQVEGLIDCADPDGAIAGPGLVVGYDFTNQKATAAGVGDANIGASVAVAPGRVHVKLVQTLS